MGLKQFKTDIASAKAQPFENVSTISQGDSDGEVVFTYTSDLLASSLEIRALSTNIDDYPRGSNFLVFTSSEHVDQEAVSFLESLAPRTESKKVCDIIRTISTRLTANLRGSSPEDADEESEGEYDSGLDDELVSDNEYEIDIDPWSSKRRTRNDGFLLSGSVEHLKNDLRAVKDAGFSVGLLTPDVVQAKGLISLSTRVSKLGIPEEALEAWGLKRSEYIILLLRLQMGYQPLEQMMTLSSTHNVVQFRVGKCAKSRPSAAMAALAFHNASKDTVGPNESVEDMGNDFMPLCMSSSLELLLNTKFLDILAIRRKRGMSWDEAISYYHSFTTDAYPSKGQSSSSEHFEEVSEASADTSGLEFLSHDFAMDEQDNCNLPLVAMQFTLQRIVQCTDYCMVCHRRMKGGFEALKPYVCDLDLCLYQYISLGLGQSIEHEVVNSPYVVDLLISFFYQAVAGNGLRDFPQGIMKSVNTGCTSNPATHFAVEVCFDRLEIDLGYSDTSSDGNIKEGDLVMLIIDGNEPNPDQPMLKGALERYTCVIESCRGPHFSFEIVARSRPGVFAVDETQNPGPVLETASSGRVKAKLFQYNTDVENIPLENRDDSVIALANAIPSVLAMKEYLTDHPGHRLASWKRMGSSVIRLLNWIIASNRSFIVQDGAVPDLARSKDCVENYDRAHLVKGVDPGLMQFRFVQGSPNKERKFMQQLQELKLEKHPYPTLFAWHGSPLKNWHSIIRTGLDFSTTLHGRAYGNGVYFSPDMQTSIGYLDPLGNVQPQVGSTSWPNSNLNITSAISMCEIINKPDLFISSRPHYVVNKVEWIQCRYLFVGVEPTSAATADPFPNSPAQDSAGYIEQDPSRLLVSGDKTHIQIPVTALPVGRRPVVTSRLPKLGSKNGAGTSSHNPITVESDSETSDDDFDVIWGKKDDDQMDIDETPSGIPPDTSVTPFEPGILNQDSLPKLPPPSWASSSPSALRSLNHAVKDLQQVQKTTQQSVLGWYIDFDNLNNLFHWIVELHSFDVSLPLAKDMLARGCNSIVLEFRFGANFPIAPPFVRVIRPRFLPFLQGGGGHVTAGGAICSELLTQSGWSPALSLEKIFLQVRVGLSDTERPAKLEATSATLGDYGILEAVDAYRRAAAVHGWRVPEDLAAIAWAGSTSM